MQSGEFKDASIQSLRSGEGVVPFRQQLASAWPNRRDMPAKRGDAPGGAIVAPVRARTRLPHRLLYLP
jgi:hypothetical protein